MHQDDARQPGLFLTWKEKLDLIGHVQFPQPGGGAGHKIRDFAPLKQLLIQIEHCTTNEGCTVPVQQIAHKFGGRSDSTTRDWINRAKKLGVLLVVRRKGKDSSYRIDWFRMLSFPRSQSDSLPGREPLNTTPPESKSSPPEIKLTPPESGGGSAGKVRRIPAESRAPFQDPSSSGFDFGSGSEFKNQNQIQNQRGDSGGVKSSGLNKPVGPWGRSLSEADLTSASVLKDELFPIAASMGWFGNAPQELLAFVALACCCVRKQKNGAIQTTVGGYFTTLARGHSMRPVGAADERRAYNMLQQLDQAAPVAEEQAEQVEPTEEKPREKSPYPTGYWTSPPKKKQRVAPVTREELQAMKRENEPCNR